jgi:hypothetical protein
MMVTSEESLQLASLVDFFDLASFRLGADALCAAARCAGLAIELSAVLPTSGLYGDGPFAATRDLRRATDLISTATIQRGD